MEAGFIFGKLSNANPKIDRQEFSLRDLAGKTIREHRKIRYQIFRTPRKDNAEDPHNEHAYAPDNIDVLLFTDETFLALEQRANGEFTHIEAYFFDGSKTLYSNSPFSF